MLSKQCKAFTNFNKATKDVIVCKILENWDNIKMGRASSSKDQDKDDKGSDDKETL